MDFISEDPKKDDRKDKKPEPPFIVPNAINIGKTAAKARADAPLLKDVADYHGPAAPVERIKVAATGDRVQPLPPAPAPKEEAAAFA